MNCPCGSGKNYSECCEPFIKGQKTVQKAEELMRARYSAYAMHEIDYILDTNHPEKRDEVDRESVTKWSSESEWLGFKILNCSKGEPEDTEGEIEFVASYIQKSIKQDHHELSTFKKLDDTWYFYDGKLVSQKPIVRIGEKIGRNDPCTCGSGKKFKNCCGK
ncbi:MAG: YchJ family protein [Clostridiales bacterium]